MARVLRRLLLDADGAIVRRRRNERALDRPARVGHPLGKSHSLGASCLSRRRSLRCCRCMVTFKRNVLMTWQAKEAHYLSAPYSKRPIQAGSQFLIAEWLAKKTGSAGRKCFLSRCHFWKGSKENDGQAMALD